MATAAAGAPVSGDGHATEDDRDVQDDEPAVGREHLPAAGEVRRYSPRPMKLNQYETPVADRQGDDRQEHGADVEPATMSGAGVNGEKPPTSSPSPGNCPDRGTGHRQETAPRP